MLDERTADRLLSGVLAPEDAPPGFSGVAALLQAAAMPPTPLEAAGGAMTVSAMVRAVTGNGAASEVDVPFVKTRRRAGLSRLLRPRIAATLMAGALALFSGLGAAGALPGPLQHAAHVMFRSIGISVPDRDSGSSTGGAGPGPTNLGPGGGSSGHGQSEAPRAPTPHKGGEGSSGDTGHGKGHGGGKHHAKGHGRDHGKGKAHHGHDGHKANRDHDGTGHDGTHEPKDHGKGDSDTDAGSDGSGPKGLCNAWSHGRGGERGKKHSSTAFQRLQDMAARGESVEEFCGNVVHHDKHAKDHDGKKHEKTKGENSKDENDEESSKNSGHKGDHGGGPHHGGKAAHAEGHHTIVWTPPGRSTPGNGTP